MLNQNGLKNYAQDQGAVGKNPYEPEAVVHGQPSAETSYNVTASPDEDEAEDDIDTKTAPGAAKAGTGRGNDLNGGPQDQKI